MPRALASLIAVVALAGCGGNADEANDYVEQVNGVQSALTQQFTSLAGRVTRVSQPEADARALREYEAAVDKAVSDLRAIDPPGEVKADHEMLVKATASYGPAIETARKVFEGQNARAIIKAQTDLNTSVRETTSKVNALASEINAALRK